MDEDRKLSSSFPEVESTTSQHTSLTVQWLRRLSQASHRGGPGSFPGLSLWDSCCKKWYWDWKSGNAWVFPVSIISTVRHTHLLSTLYMIGNWQRPNIRQLKNSSQASWIAFYFLGAFAKLRKATINFVMSVCPSVRMEQLGSHWADFHEIWYLKMFWKICLENPSFIKIWQE
jgi:hypothetical protein